MMKTDGMISVMMKERLGGLWHPIHRDRLLAFRQGPICAYRDGPMRVYIDES
jgi:hypothetical protein